MKKQTLKFIIRQDGYVTEEVMGVIGNQCQEITKSIEEKLGEVSYVETKPEYLSLIHISEPTRPY